MGDATEHLPVLVRATAGSHHHEVDVLFVRQLQYFLVRDAVTNGPENLDVSRRSTLTDLVDGLLADLFQGVFQSLPFVDVFVTGVRRVHVSIDDVQNVQRRVAEFGQSDCVVDRALDARTSVRRNQYGVVHVRILALSAVLHDRIRSVSVRVELRYPAVNFDHRFPRRENSVLTVREPRGLFVQSVVAVFMSDSPTPTMTAQERDEFLGTGGTGVLSFARSGDEPPHSVPVSYGYDGSENTFYFRLAVDSDSEKKHLLEDPVTFVVYGRRDDTWRSVVAKGQLEGTTEESAAKESLQGLQRVHIPIVDVFGRPTGDVPFEFFRLVPEEFTSREESPAIE